MNRISHPDWVKLCVELNCAPNQNTFCYIPMIVTTCKKNHGLLGNDVLNINSTKLINEIKMEKKWKVKKI